MRTLQFTVPVTPDKTVSLQEDTLPQFYAYLHRHQLGGVYIKLAATAEGLSNGYVRAPRLPLEGEELVRVYEIIKDGIATRPVLPEYLNLPLGTTIEQAS